MVVSALSVSEVLLASHTDARPLQHALCVAELPPHHRDPFDRLLVAQSQIERLPLMTADPAITAYDVEIIWAGREKRPSVTRRRSPRRALDKAYFRPG